jgi:flavin reductase (DIM6/NTAB) family NADH-FMN oxidoreductase RutF
MHIVSEPAILYFGTPVVLISTVNEDGSFNLAPMSSAFWLGWRCIIGLSGVSKTTQNIIRTGQCVLNLPSADQADMVDRLALTTGSDPVPQGKLVRGYRHEKEKFALAGFTPAPSQTVKPPRALQCPVQMEAVVEATHAVAENDDALRGRIVTFELRVQRVHADRSILSFQKFYGLEPAQAHGSTLASIPEALYRSPDVDRARVA